MKIYTLNIPPQHPCLEILARYGETKCFEQDSFKRDSLDIETALIFVRTSDEASPALVDFVSSDFSLQELELRLLRLVRLGKNYSSNDVIEISSDITNELTKKQLIILKALLEAKEQGLSKEVISKKIWGKKSSITDQASGFNVHMLHLRRRLEPFGFEVIYCKSSRVYRLETYSKNEKGGERSVG